MRGIEPVNRFPFPNGPSAGRPAGDRRLGSRDRRGFSSVIDLAPEDFEVACAPRPRAADGAPASRDGALQRVLPAREFLTYEVIARLGEGGFGEKGRSVDRYL